MMHTSCIQRWMDKPRRRRRRRRRRRPSLLRDSPTHIIRYARTHLEAVVLVLRQQHVLPVLLQHGEELAEGAVDAWRDGNRGMGVGVGIDG